MCRLTSAVRGVFLGGLLGLLVVAWGHAQERTPDISKELEVAQASMNDPHVKEALAYVDSSHDETVQEWLGLCRAFGPTGDEIYRARYISHLFHAYGLEGVYIDEYSNVTGIRRGMGSGPKIVFTALMDSPVMWPKDQPIEPLVADGRVWCPGVSSGIAQVLTILRALNAGGVQTQGEVWFVMFAAENFGGLGSAYWIEGNYPYNLDWRQGDIVVNLNGGGGTSVWVGSGPYIHWSKLRIFTPIDRGRFEPHSVDALAQVITRVRSEIGQEKKSGDEEAPDLNMSRIEGSPMGNAPVPEASVTLDLRSPSEQRLEATHRKVQQIAAEVCAKMDCRHHYTVTMKQGSEGIDGWDKMNNRPARMAAAAGKALYEIDPVINPNIGCGDCRRLIMGGMPAISLRGNVVDYGGGRFEVRRRRPVSPEAQRKSGGFYDSTAAEEIDRVWSGVKQGIVFAASYSGLAR